MQLNPITTDHPSVQMLAQLGGNRFIAMTGAKDFVSADNPQPRLIFRLPKSLTKSKGTHFEISLTPDDTYTLVFFKFYNGVRRIISVERDIYCDMLRERFTHMTGLRTSL